MHTIGVDIGGTKIEAGVVTATGDVLATVRHDTPATDVAAIEDAVAQAVATLRRDHRVGAIGVAAAGYIDPTGSRVLFAPNLAWRDEPLGPDLRERTGLPVLVANDANAAAWGEFRFGAGRDVEDLLLLTVGTGLGGGVVTGGVPLRGASGVCAEVGHVRVVVDGHPCGCGNRGCWEQYASGTALERAARELVGTDPVAGARLLGLADGDPTAVDGRAVTSAAREGDPAATRLLADLGRWLGEGAAGLAAVLDPAVIAVGGGVAAAGDLLLAPARAAFEAHLIGRGHRPAPQIVPAALGNRAGLVGAADLAVTLLDDGGTGGPG